MNSKTRSLAIEPKFKGFREQLKPGIRLTGKWLQAAGFHPSQRCTIRFVPDGVIELTAEIKTAQPAIPLPHKE